MMLLVQSSFQLFCHLSNQEKNYYFAFIFFRNVRLSIIESGTVHCTVENILFNIGQELVEEDDFLNEQNRYT